MNATVIRYVAIAAGLWAGAAAPAQQHVPLAGVPLSRMDLPWWKKRFAAKAAELRHGPVDLVFYGDSITQDFEYDGPQPWLNFAPVWNRFYGHRHAVNLGFKGDATAHLLWRIENGEADGISPRAAVVLIGANNFGRLHWPESETEPAIEKIVAELRQRLPRTHILLIGVLPSIRSAWVDRNTTELNQALAARYRDRRDATFIDLAPLFMRGRHVDPGKFLDPHLSPADPPLHPDPSTMAAMAAAIEPTLNRWLGEAPQ